jgi:16S rRNA (guanine527-N7)-methyltransferase
VKQDDLGSQARARLEELRSAWGLSEATAGLLGRLVGLVATEPGAPTSVAAPLEAIDTHVADSLTALSIKGFSDARSVVDIGSGAGFPGLVLAAALPEVRVDLLESARKKCAFIDRAVSTLELPNATVVCERAEQWGAAEGAEAYAAATARAVGRLATILEYAAPMLELGGVLVAWKGRRDREEEEEAELAATVLGMSLAAVERVQPFTGSRNRHLHVYRKQGSCPPGYPRRPGMARKRPLGAAGARPAA